MKNSLSGKLNFEPKHMNLISSKIAKHVDVLKLFTNIALRMVDLQQLLHYDVGLTTHFLRNVTSYSCRVVGK